METTLASDLKIWLENGQSLMPWQGFRHDRDLQMKSGDCTCRFSNERIDRDPHRSDFKFPLSIRLKIRNWVTTLRLLVTLLTVWERVSGQLLLLHRYDGTEGGPPWFSHLQEDEKIRRRGERSLIGSVLFSYREPAGRELRFQESSRFRSYSAARAYLSFLLLWSGDAERLLAGVDHIYHEHPGNEAVECRATQTETMKYWTRRVGEIDGILNKKEAGDYNAPGLQR
ncbi:uncharacterized protein BKA78DRAFT_384154 [Phyllosticta capitalensis]|uniref:uncharacterized protein n=1 Tax=Phyllosticta capitalensis TaxID=121624 RepID=UPI0031303C68